MVRVARRELNTVPAIILVASALHAAANAAAHISKPLAFDLDVLDALRDIVATPRLTSVVGASAAVAHAALGVAFALAPAAPAATAAAAAAAERDATVRAASAFVETAIGALRGAERAGRDALYARCAAWLLRATGLASPAALLPRVRAVGGDAELIALLFVRASSEGGAEHDGTTVRLFDLPLRFVRILLTI